MVSQARKPVPVWKRGKNAYRAGPVVIVRGRNAHKAAQQFVGGKVVPASVTAQAAVIANSGAYRFRWQLVPVAWLATITLTGLVLHQAHLLPGAVIAGIVTAAAVLLLTRHLNGIPGRCSTAMGLLTAVWLPLLAEFGMTRPLPFFLLGSWAAIAAPWAHHYRWRQAPPPARRGLDDIEIWDQRIASKRLKGTWLAEPREIPGGRQWTIMLPHGDLVVSDVMANWPRIAGAWDKPRTEVYPEPYPDGRESRALLTILKRDSLSDVREWDGSTIDPATGRAVIGRFPDGKPVHEAFFQPMSGARHSIVAGADGSGKSALLDLGLCISATSGLIVPVVLDPQEGQALPAWREHVLYAAGVEECLLMLEGVHAGMLDRSKYLSSLRWTDEDGDRHKGMPFFDTRLCGLPLVEVTLDEAPAFLTDPAHRDRAVWLTGDGVKRGRKTGTRFRLAAQVPSLAELGAQPIRSMLVGGNVICLRTGDRLSGGMVLLEADPSDLPKYFANGQMTYGLGYSAGPDQRPGTPMRLDWVRKPAKVAAAAQIPPLDERFAEAMDKAMRGEFRQQINAAVTAANAAEQMTAPGGQSVADAIVTVLTTPMDRGTILIAAGDQAVAWGRSKPFPPSAVAASLAQLTTAGTVSRSESGMFARAAKGMMSS